MSVKGFSYFGGRHGESAALNNLMTFHGVKNPVSGQPMSEALCFGIAGGIGAGLSFCPSVVRYGGGSGIAVVGRHKIYATGATWYQGFADRLGLKTQSVDGEGRYRHRVGTDPRETQCQLAGTARNCHDRR